MAGANLGLLVSNFFRHKRSVLFAIFLGTVIAIVLVASVGARSKGSSASRSLAAFVNWAQFGHQEDDAESRGDSRQEGEPDSQQQQAAFQVQASNHAGQGKVPHYLSPEERLKRIAATFRERNLGDENLCAAIKRGEIEVDRHKRRGGKKSAWIATWKGKKVVVKRNDFEVNVALNKNLFYAWDSNDNGRVERIEFFKSLANALERMGTLQIRCTNIFLCGSSRPFFFMLVVDCYLLSPWVKLGDCGDVGRTSFLVCSITNKRPVLFCSALWVLRVTQCFDNVNDVPFPVCHFACLRTNCVH